MQVSFRKSFLKDIKKIKDPDTLKLIEKVIIEAEHAKLLADIKGLEKLTGYKGYLELKDLLTVLGFIQRNQVWSL